MRNRMHYSFSCTSAEPQKGICHGTPTYVDETLVQACSDECINGECHDCQDGDGDGYKDSSCGGNDCNDNDQNINPGATETCNDKDDNCNGQVDEIDNDRDGYRPTSCGGSDCNDNNGNINPGQSENCNNGIDDDCDTAIDDQDPDCGGCFCTDWANSNCGGGFCASIHRQQTRTCTPSGCNSEQRCIADTSCGSNCDATSYTSCNTAYPMLNSGKDGEVLQGMCGQQQFYKVKTTETCDIHWEIVEGNAGVGVDYDLYTKWDGSCPTLNNYNCRPYTDQKNEVCQQTSMPPGTYYSMVNRYSGSGYYNIAVILSNCHGPCEPTEETCNNQDDNCNGQTDENLARQCGTTNVGECKYGTQTCSAGNWGSCQGNIEPTTEICDGKDNNCNNQIDEALSAPDCQLQQGVCAGSKKRCGGSSGWLDCNEYDYGPDYQQEEISCDNKDNDCDDQIDEDVKLKIYRDNDGDGYGNEQDFDFACSTLASYSTYHFDCNDNDNTIHVGAPEICDNKDNDCNNFIDETCFALKQGWNLFSFPLRLINNTIASIFKNINFSSIFSYGSWYYYFNETNNNFNTINETRGYWINSLDNQNLQIEGIQFTYPMNLSLKQGKNLISYPSLNTTLINESLKNINFTSIRTYRNNKWYTHNKARNGSLNTLKNLTPGHAYWINIPNNTNIKFNGTHYN